MMIEPAVYLTLNAGLGNQLFQYACGFALAQARGVPLKVRWTGTDTHIKRNLELGFFDEDLQIMTPEEWRYWKPRRHQVGLDRRFRWTRPIVRLFVAPYYGEHELFRFDPAVLDLPVPCYLEGGWQNPRYFAGAGDSLRSVLACYDRLGAAATAAAEHLRSTTSVSIHVRRGDYVWGPHAYRYEGVCTRNYYSAAIDRVLSVDPKARFFLFSDEPEQAYDVLPTDVPMLRLEGGPFSMQEDLLLMSQCRHHIISNSTFAWWGAWIGDRSTGLNVAPRAWLSEAGRRESCPDGVLPDHWVKLGS